ncbi:MAG: hypothetical protein NT075_27210, partial [Chloroflexi bacterium]|nr:hypothetical protein [Chloroflexota bacterium]
MIIGVRKERADPDQGLADYLNSLGLDNLPDLLENNQTCYTIPNTYIATEKLIFRKITLSYEDVLRQVPRHGAYHNRQFKDWMTASHDFAFRPVVPLKTGHVGSLISSGQMGVINLQTVAAKGRATKVVEFFDAQGRKVERTDASMTESRERFTTEVTTINQAGQHESITSVADMQAFLEHYAGQIASAISARYQPLYTKATDREWQHLGKLMRQKRLPGRQTGGLLPAQKHAAAACVRSLKAQGGVDLIGKMGTDKTCTSLAALDLANAYPAIIMCPGHMVEKWAREAREVVPGVRATIITNLADLNEFVTKAQTGGKHIAVLSKERVKLGSGWEPAVLWRLRRVGIKHDATGMPTATAIGKVPACPSCGTLLTDKEGLPRLTMPANKRLFCDHCHTPLYKYCGLRRWPLTDYIKRQLKGFFQCFIADEFHQYKGKSTDQAESYHHLVLASRYTINL